MNNNNNNNNNNLHPESLNLSDFTIWQLRRDGFKVRINHSRYTVSEFPLRNAPLRDTFQITKGEINPCGGKTLVIIRTPEGVEYKGESKCSKLDNYCRRRGVSMALGRLKLVVVN